MAADSSWLAPIIEQRPAPPPRMAALPPNVRRARRVGEEAAPDPEPFPPAPPTPQPLSEPQARALLAQRQQTMRETDAASDAAQAALHRSQQHAEACTAELAAFSDIDEQLKALHVEALRGGDIRPQITVPPELRRRITEHEQARLACDAATAAVETFEREAQVARDAASSARIAVSDTADQLVARHALAVLARRNELAAELETLDVTVLSFEQFAKPAPRRISEFALELYGSGKMRVALLDTGPWRELHQRLSENAAAELTL